VGGASELTALGAGDLARGIAARRFSSNEVVSAYIDRQNEVQPRINAVAVALHDQALATAKAADRGRPEDGQQLYGVPVTVKECFDVVGTATTAGIVGRAADLKSDDAELVSRLRAAGAIVTAKSNLSQLLLYAESDNPLFGRTNNPWDLARTPGGSSGGEGALLAAAASPLGLGTDLGGSVRIPAHFCGVCSLRATPGVLSLAGTADQFLLGHVQGIPDSAGPIARTVADVKLGMDALGAPVPDATVDGLVIGLYDDDGFVTASTAVRRAALQAASALEAAGARVVPFEPPSVTEAMDVFYGLISADGAKAFEALIAGEHVDPRIRQLMQLGTMPAWLRPVVGAGLAVARQGRLSHLIRTTGLRTDEQVQALIARRDAYRKRFEEAVTKAGVDVILCPPHALPALTHGASADLGQASFNYTLLYNVLAWPAGVVPVTRVRPGEMDRRARGGDLIDRAARRVDKGSAGLPVGVQVAARPHREDLILAVMAAVESALSGSVDYPRVPPAPPAGLSSRGAG
jgi:Asp-tRNA(Asn)/Glu-tRNA(Gln) amidotransferase A subunit family amidase